MEKETLLNLLKEGKSTNNISKETGIEKHKIARMVKKYGLQDQQRFRKTTPFNLDKIDNKEIAYVIGFLCGDSHIINDTVEFSVCLQDKQIVEFISEVLDCNVTIDNTFVKKDRRFPRCRTSKKLHGITRFTKSEKKTGRMLPIVSKDLRKYLLLGFFDADGCITWGERKDRGRIWHKISFTSSLSLLTCVQKMLLEINISSVIRPKTGENCFVLEVANRRDMFIFFNWIYSDRDFLVLNRKFDKFDALRLKLGEFGETV